MSTEEKLVALRSHARDVEGLADRVERDMRKMRDAASALLALADVGVWTEDSACDHDAWTAAVARLREAVRS